MRGVGFSTIEAWRPTGRNGLLFIMEPIKLLLFLMKKLFQFLERLVTGDLRMAYRWKSRGHAEWPRAPAKVIGRRIQEGMLCEFEAEVAYYYQVEGKYHSGFYRREFNSMEKAEQFVKQFPNDYQLMIRYQADKPQISRVRKKDNFNALGG